MELSTSPETRNFIRKIEKNIWKLTDRYYIKLEIPIIESFVLNYIEQELKERWFKVIFIEEEKWDNWGEKYMIITV